MYVFNTLYCQQVRYSKKTDAPVLCTFDHLFPVSCIGLSEMHIFYRLHPHFRFNWSIIMGPGGTQKIVYHRYTKLTLDIIGSPYCSAIILLKLGNP